MARKKQTAETNLKGAIKDALARTGWFSFPVLQGLGAYDGIADIIMLKAGRVIFLEVKAPNWKGELSPDQKVFRDDIGYFGGEYMVCDNIDRLIEWLEGGEQGEI
jgi:hypothetical protein